MENLISAGKGIRNILGNLTYLSCSVVEKLDSAIHRINHYPVDRYLGNHLRYPQGSDLSGG